MSDTPTTSLASEHRDFFKRFKSFWAAPSGARVAELIRPDATIHFTGSGTFTGAEYIAGATRTYLGVDRFRLVDGMAIEEHVIFDSAVLQPAG
jgi:hypothetical protein